MLDPSGGCCTQDVAQGYPPGLAFCLQLGPSLHQDAMDSLLCGCR